MPTVGEVYGFLNELAPVETKMDFDNVGLLCGEASAPVRRILTALDVTDGVIGEAETLGAELIVAHHPLFFDLKAVTDRTPEERRVIRLLRSGIAAICMHTNLDAAEGGVNTALARAAGIGEPRLLETGGTDGSGRVWGIGRWGELAAPVPLEEFMTRLKRTLSVSCLRYTGRGPVHRVAVVGGSGGEYAAAALALGCDTLVTADVKYHQFLAAAESGLNLIDGDHFCTENVVIPPLAGRLAARFPELEVAVSRMHGQTVQFF